jgi:RNA 2',3'-cyclic 3'-phosphodiesterase
MFAAVVPPPEALEDLEEFLGPRRDADRSLRWTDREQWHVTLAFMPRVPERAFDELLERLSRAAARRSPFTAAVVGAGAFPYPGRAKVLWSGLSRLSPEPELARLAVGARAAASKSGAEVNGTRFHPHLTLARVPRPGDVTRWLRVLEAYQGPTWLATQMVLVESHLGEGPGRRPRYEVVDSFPLGAASRGAPAAPADT